MSRFLVSILSSLLLAAALPLAALAGPVETFPATVIHVDDGDTVVLLTSDRRQMKVRIASIDAPESAHTNKQKGRVGQPYADKSKRYLSDAVKGKAVDVVCYEKDRFERSVCDLFLNGSSVSVDMVTNGWAWANTASKGRYLRNKSLPARQAGAKEARIGLWAGANPIPPWEWRKSCWQDGVCPQ